ncbi:MAG: M14 family zinc carboxypeptidase [Candidatus Krumholzibacteriia bacterium]
MPHPRQQSSSFVVLLLVVATVAAGLCTAAAAPVAQAPATGLRQPPPPTELPGLAYEAPFFPAARHELPVPSPETLLGHPIGARFASAAQITDCLRAWAEASPRVAVVEYARSHEGRPLHYALITAPENHARLHEIRAGIARLADPRGLDQDEADRLLADLPAVGWFAYSIHGNETSGADAALAVIHHLAADAAEETEQLLRDLIVIVDPLMNPDGRTRFAQQVVEHRGRAPNVDDQSLLRRGDWPSGRTNHYFFDLNRDFLVAVHPETRGRMREIGAWYPLLLVDGHEMGSQDTYLFSPPRDPINPHLPPSRLQWGEVFAADQARAFDRYGWPYYTGEWNDEWYLGYSSWASYRAGLFVLYEQARVAEDAVRQGGDKLLSYREAVHHQVVSTMANLRTLHDHRQELKRDFLRQRRLAAGPESPYAGRSWAVVPGRSPEREQRFRELMDLHGVELRFLPAAATVRAARDPLGRRHDRLTLPAGTLIVAGRQPEGYLAAALLDLDPRVPDETLRKERQELLRKGRSRMYDVTAWSLPLMLDLEVYEIPSAPPGEARLLEAGRMPPGVGRSGEAPADGAAGASDAARVEPVGWAVDGRDDGSLGFATRLLEQGVQVRLAERAFRGADHPFVRGSLVVTLDDNRARRDELDRLVSAAAEAWGQTAVPLGGGLGAGDLPDLGGRHFRRLEAPSIGLVGRGGTSTADFGEIWFALDHQLGIRHSHLDEDRLTRDDLRRYNLLILPHRWGAGLPEGLPAALSAWVEAGGTLIAIGGAAAALVGSEEFPSQAQDLAATLDDPAPYELAIWREWLAQTGTWAEDLDVWSHTVPSDVPAPPITGAAPDSRNRRGRGERLAEGSDQERATKEASAASGPTGAEARRRLDTWQRLFMPQGAFLSARVDTLHWLTAGCGQVLPVLTGSAVGRGPVLVTKGTAEAPVRFGVFQPAVDAGGDSGTDAGAGRIGWSPVPPGHEVRLRMSGLLWPEAAHRLTSSAYVTRERRGRGQVILFAGPAAFRGATIGTQRLLLNAIVYGPGAGADQPIRP